jgi:uncharacterized protein (DUF952 family)
VADADDPAQAPASDGDLMHIATAAEWDEAQRRGAVAPASLGSEGFVHCSTRRQLPSTLARHFPGAGRLVLLQLDAAEVAPDLRWEEGQPGELFPHVYAAIPLTAVVAVTPVTAPGA